MTHLRSVSPRQGRRRFAVGDPVQCSDGRPGIVRALLGEMFCEVMKNATVGKSPNRDRTIF